MTVGDRCRSCNVREADERRCAEESRILRATIDELKGEVERQRRLLSPQCAHVCCGKYLGYEHVCPDCSAVCLCAACYSEGFVAPGPSWLEALDA
jgi:hypothetical protein